MKTLLAVLAMVLLASVVFADQEYNPMTRSWETIPQGASKDWDTQYNPMTREWSIQPPNAQIEYNPMERTWDWSSGHGNKVK